MTRIRSILTIALAIVALGSEALGSGGPPPIPDYVTAYALQPEDIAALSDGRLGILKGAAPAAIRYLDWRLLHGLAVGTGAGTALATPCCGDPVDRSFEWVTARRQVPGASSDIYYLATDRPGPDYTGIPTCFADAFDTAVATLHDRIGRYGAASPAVRAWLNGQDAVFAACSKAGIVLPALPADAPQWLRADHAYQAAALALYDGRLADAARDFADIARDPASPWRPKTPYLLARVSLREAVLHPDADSSARVHDGIARLAATPPGTFGRGEVDRMAQVLEYHEHPAALLGRLDHALNQRVPTPDIASKFKDYMSLPTVGVAVPDAADWVRTLQPKDRGVGLAHAQARWAQTHDTAWLVAALSLVMPDDPAAAALTRDAAAVPPGSPAWQTAQYHLSRLTMAHGDAASIRARTDAILARTDLTRSDRNVFAAIRMQLATGLSDVTRFGLRHPYCTGTDGSCIGGGSPEGDNLVAKRADGFVGWGGDARAVIDRLPLAVRMRLAHDPAIPRDLRLDLALTNFTRAVLLRDDGAVDRLARMLADLLPQLRGDWRTIANAPPGADKRFAEYFVMAKIPTLRTDLASYTRPVGAHDRDFGGYWVDWTLIAPRQPAPPRPFPADGAYLPGGYWNDADPGQEDGGEVADLACFGQCGAGAFALHLPAFAAASLGTASSERRRLAVASAEGKPAGPSLWTTMFDYVRAHPNDPRSPEALYRLIRVARWGGNSDHLGKRAFMLIHARYPASPWTRRSPFYYD